MPLNRKHQIAIKAEAAEGADPWGGGAPAATDVIEVFEPAVSDATEFQDRAPAGASLSRPLDTPGRQSRSITFESDMVGNTTGGTPTIKRNALPPWDKLILAAGFKFVGITELTAAVVGGPFIAGERVEKDATNFGIALNAADAAGGVLYAVAIEGSLTSATTITGISSGATMATPTSQTAGRAYLPTSEKSISVDLTVAGFTPGSPSVGDVLIFKRAGLLIASGQLLDATDPITVNQFFGPAILNLDTIEDGAGNSAVVDTGAGTALNGISIGVYSNLDSLARRMFGSRGGFTLTGEPGQGLSFAWSFQGTGPDPIDEGQVAGVSLPSLRASRWQGATADVGYDRDQLLEPPTSTPDDFAVCIPIKSIEVDPTNTIEDRRDPCEATGAGGSSVTDRDPVVTLELDQIGLLAFDWFRLLSKGVPMHFGTFWGSEAGNQMAIAGNQFQVVELADGEADGLATHTVTLKGRRIREAGDDELVIAKL